LASEWKKAREVLHILKGKGFDSYIVGGAVRDLLLDRKLADIDIVTTATPYEVSKCFLKTYRMNNLHETVIVKYRGEHYEVTTIRGKKLVEDVKCRDLTINSLAMDYEGKLIDFVSGQNDLVHNVLRSIEPYDRMTEDPLRMLRVFRFVSELGFDVDLELMTVITAQHDLLKKVAVERVMKEWIKLLKGKHRNQALRMVKTTQLFKSIPGLMLTEHALEQLAHFRSLTHSSDTLCLTAFCLCLDKVDEPFLRNLALSNEQSKKIRERLTYYEKRNHQQWGRLDLYYASIQVACDVETLRLLGNKESQSIDQLQELWEALPIRHKSELAISGIDVIHSLEKPQGPWVKEALTLAEQLVVTGQYRNNKEDLLNTLLERRDKL
jgi:tRNA nucleotidyltransferase (CCA-adding enzyme)